MNLLSLPARALSKVFTVLDDRSLLRLRWDNSQFFFVLIAILGFESFKTHDWRISSQCPKDAI